jgi:hypothetical protein
LTFDSDLDRPRSGPVLDVAQICFEDEEDDENDSSNSRLNIPLLDSPHDLAASSDCGIVNTPRRYTIGATTAG